MTTESDNIVTSELKDFIVSFHINATSIKAAEEWRKRALAILDASQNQLVPEMGADDGAYCSGHVALEVKDCVSSSEPSFGDVISRAEHLESLADQRRHLGAMHDETIAKLKQVQEVAAKFYEALYFMVNQFACTNGKTLESGEQALNDCALSALEDAFRVLGIKNGISREEFWKHDPTIQAEVRTGGEQEEKSGAGSLLQPLPPQWIPVSKKLPPLSQPILLYTPENEMVDTGWRCFDGEKEIFQLDRTFPQDQPIIYELRDERVTHWMPLPAAPQPVPQHSPIDQRISEQR